jgi:hypothetical protein
VYSHWLQQGLGSSILGIHIQYRIRIRIQIFNDQKTVKVYSLSSIADPGRLSRILIFIHPGSSDSNKRGGGKRFVVHLFVATNITRSKFILFLNKEQKYETIHEES